MPEQTVKLQLELIYDDGVTDKDKLSCAMDILALSALLTPGVLTAKGDISMGEFIPDECLISVVEMYQAAVEAVDHVGQANWAGRVEAAKRWLDRVCDGKTDKSLDQIQEVVNKE